MVFVEAGGPAARAANLPGTCRVAALSYDTEQDTVMSILEIDNLSLTLGERRVLDRLNVDIWEGHIHALVGPNGAGKSTLARAVMGLAGYRAYSGDIRFNGKSLNQLAVSERARLGITLAWQEPARFEGLSVRKFISAGMKKASADTVDSVLAQVGLQPGRYADRPVDQSLSGGERKRIELASIVAMGPRLVIMDEPDSGIDVEALERIFEVLELLKDRGTTVLMITHSPTVLERSEHAFLMCCGRIIDKGSVERIAPYFEDKCIPCNHKNVPLDEELV